MKKNYLFLSLILTAVVCMFMLYGCGGGTNTTPSSSELNSSTNAAAEASLRISNGSPYDQGSGPVSRIDTKVTSKEVVKVTENTYPGMELNIRISHMALSSDGITWITLISSATEINLFDNRALTGGGLSVSIPSIPVGDYKYLRVSIDSIKFVYNGVESQDQWSSVSYMLNQMGHTTSPYVYFSYNGKDPNGVSCEFMPAVKVDNDTALTFNIFMPFHNIGGQWPDLFLAGSPAFLFSGNTASNLAAKVTLRAQGVAGSNTNVYVGMFNVNPTTSYGRNPIMGVALPNNGNGTAGPVTINVPVGTNLYFMGFEDVDGNFTTTGRPEEATDRFYAYGDIMNLNSVNLSPGQTANVTVNHVSLPQGGPGAPGGQQTGSGTLKVRAISPSYPTVINLTQPNNLFFVGLVRVVNGVASDSPEVFAIYNLSASTFDTITVTLTSLQEGTFRVVAILDIGGNMHSTQGPVIGSDYLGLHGGLPPATIIISDASPNVDISATPIVLQLYQLQ